MACGLLGQAGQLAILNAAKENEREPDTAANLRMAVNSVKEATKKLRSVLQTLTVQA
jgi:hypothetical protein